MSVVEAGTVASVDTKPVGSPVVGTASSGALSVFVNDNAKFSPSDEVYITPLDADTGDYYVIDAVDDEQGITLTTGLVDDLTEGSWVALSPVRTATIATVQLAESGEVRPCVVLHTLRDAFRDGIRDPAEAETVLTVMADGVRYVIDIIAQSPVRDITDSVVGADPLADVLQAIYDTANDNAAAAADAAATATTAMTAANGKNTVTYSLSSPGTTANTAGDIWFRKDAATQTVIEQWEGRGGTTWQQVTLANAVIANLDAGKLTAGSAFTNALSVKTNFTLGDASTNGVIQTYNFAGASVGVYIDKFGIVAKGGSIAGASITGGTFTGGTFQTNTSGQRVVIDTSNRVTFYDSSGFVGYIYGGSGTLRLDASTVAATGDMNVLGNLQATRIIMTGGGTMNVTGKIAATSDISSGGDLDVAGDVTANSYYMSTSVASSGGNALFEGAVGLIRPQVAPSLSKWKRDVTPLPVDLDSLAALGRGAISFRYRDDVELPFGVDDFDEVFHGVSLDMALQAGGLDILIGNDDNGEPFQFLSKNLPIALLAGYGHDHGRIDNIERRLSAAGI